MHQTSTMMEFGALVRCQTNQKSGLTEAIVNWIRQLPLREGFTSAAFFVGGSDVKKRRSRSTENCDTEIFWPTNVVMGDLRAKWRPAERKQLKSFKDPRHSSIWVWRVYGVQPKRHILVGRWWLISHQTWEYYGIYGVAFFKPNSSEGMLFFAIFCKTVKNSETLS